MASAEEGQVWETGCLLCLPCSIILDAWILLQKTDEALTYIGQYGTCRSSINAGAGKFLVRRCCGHQGLVRVQEAARKIHSQHMHGKLRVIIMLVLGQAALESQIAGH